MACNVEIIEPDIGIRDCVIVSGFQIVFVIRV